MFAIQIQDVNLNADSNRVFSVSVFHTHYTGATNPIEL